MLKIALPMLLAPSLAFAMVGGEVTPRESSFGRRTVLLISGNANRCTGTLISRRLILTAAHCLPSPASSYTAVFTNDLTPYLEGKERVEVRRVSETIIDSRFDRSQLLNDVAIAVLAEPAPESAAIAPLPETVQEIAEGASLVSLGYGLQNRQGFLFPMTPNKLGKAWEPVQLKQKQFSYSRAPEHVQKHFQSDVNENRLHVAQPDGGICVGDSGGPVYWQREGEEPVLVGVNSAVMAESDALCGRNALIMRVETALEWIRPQLAKYTD